jgi:hypothetical protein
MLHIMLTRAASTYVTYPLGFRIYDPEDSSESVRGPKRSI